MSGIHPLFIALTQAAASFWSKAVRRRVLHFFQVPSRGIVFASDLLNRASAPSPDGEFQLHPHYRTQRPIDELLRKIRPGLDEFVTEKYASEIETILRQWQSGLLKSPRNFQSIKESLAPMFRGSTPKATRSRIVRSTAPVEVRQSVFDNDQSISAQEFVPALKGSMEALEQLITADLQVGEHPRRWRGPDYSRPL